MLQVSPYPNTDPKPNPNPNPNPYSFPYPYPYPEPWSFPYPYPYPEPTEPWPYLHTHTLQNPHHTYTSTPSTPMSTFKIYIVLQTTSITFVFKIPQLSWSLLVPAVGCQSIHLLFGMIHIKWSKHKMTITFKFLLFCLYGCCFFYLHGSCQDHPATDPWRTRSIQCR